MSHLPWVPHAYRPRLFQVLTCPQAAASPALLGLVLSPKENTLPSQLQVSPAHKRRRPRLLPRARNPARRSATCSPTLACKTLTPRVHLVQSNLGSPRSSRYPDSPPDIPRLPPHALPRARGAPCECPLPAASRITGRVREPHQNRQPR